MHIGLHWESTDGSTDLALAMETDDFLSTNTPGILCISEAWAISKLQTPFGECKFNFVCKNIVNRRVGHSYRMGGRQMRVADNQRTGCMCSYTRQRSGPNYSVPTPHRKIS